MDISSGHHAPQWDWSMGLTWSGRWHTFADPGPDRAAKPKRQYLALCGTLIYDQSKLPSGLKKSLGRIAAGETPAPECKRCARIVGAPGSRASVAAVPTVTQLQRLIDPAIWAASCEDQRTLGEKYAWEQRRAFSAGAAHRIHEFLSAGGANL